MYLKSIEVHGFKSFANKILFEFHNGITGIVGPNGSGKSNVADAVRWVLGEQSAKQLRGSNMQDVIFSGTENRKPFSYAYVAITLDNSDKKLNLDYNEITIARRVYRSGESEYLINGVACRLRDVQELFYDTGIGKEGYSIIGQGQIEKILSGKPEERRELFDEAAGIVKFKRRKIAAQKKLENQRQNLLRVRDILSELEKQLGPLERQSEKAKIYLSKRDELRIADVKLFLLEVDQISEQLKELEKNLQITEENFKKSQESYDAVKGKYEDTEKKMEQLDQAIGKLREELSQISVSKEKQEGEIHVLEEQIRGAKRNRELYKSRREAVGKEKEDLSGQKEKYEEEIAKSGEQLTEVRSRRDGVMEEVSGPIDEAQYRALVEQGNTEFLELLEKEKTTIARLEKMELAVQGFISEEENLVQKRKTWVEQQNQLRAQTDADGKAYNRERGRLESMVAIAERYDGYGNSIRRVMEKKEDEPGLYGVVADLIHVEKEYETAVETALGGAIQNVVTDNEDTAKRMIAYLKQNKYGRATFLPLTTVGRKPQSVNEGALKEKGVIGLANTLVQSQEAYSGLLSHLLGRTYVVDHIDTAIALARKYQQSLRIVTLEGESLQPGGSMTGGAFRNAGNLLGRKREITELEELVANLKASLKVQNQHLESIQKAREVLRGDLGRTQEELQQARLKENDIRNHLMRIQEQKKNKAIEQLREKISQIQLEETSLIHKDEFARENRNRILGEIQKSEEEIEKLVFDSKQSEEEILEKKQAVENLRATIDTDQGAYGELEKNLSVFLEEKESQTAKYRGFFKESEELSKERNHLDKELFRLGNQKEKLSEGLESRNSYMWEEYELTYNNAKMMFTIQPTEEDASVLKKLVHSIKEDIRKLGDVNVNAIEDYKELLERFTFLNDQHEDLVNAEQSLLTVIEDLDTGMRKQFLEKFADIQREYNTAFRQLFGGGKGSLELIEGEDVLESGIRIIAQPPGKKLQNMMQLSGGEKALTAISLLFAIQNLKPSPFCLLDEIEAALDDSNVGRFAKYLHQLAENTQFIVITHRRGTMAAADRLYGITMQEKGVSTLVSVSLIENELKE